MQKFALNPKPPWANFAAVPRCCQKPRLFAFGANLEMSDNSPVIYLLGGLPRRAGGGESGRAGRLHLFLFSSSLAPK